MWIYLAVFRFTGPVRQSVHAHTKRHRFSGTIWTFCEGPMRNRNRIRCQTQVHTVHKIISIIIRRKHTVFILPPGNLQLFWHQCIEGCGQLNFALIKIICHSLVLNLKNTYEYIYSLIENIYFPIVKNITQSLKKIHNFSS